MALKPRHEPHLGTHGDHGGLVGIAHRLDYLFLELDAIRTLSAELLAGHASSSGPRSVRRLSHLSRLHRELILPMIASLEASGGESTPPPQRGPSAWMDHSAAQEDENAALDEDEFKRIMAELETSRQRLLQKLAHMGDDALARSVPVAGEGEDTPSMTVLDVLSELIHVDHLVLRDVALALNDVKRDAEQAKRTMAGHHPEAS